MPCLKYMMLLKIYLIFTATASYYMETEIYYCLLLCECIFDIMSINPHKLLFLIRSTRKHVVLIHQRNSTDWNGNYFYYKLRTNCLFFYSKK